MKDHEMMEPLCSNRYGRMYVCHGRRLWKYVGDDKEAFFGLLSKDQDNEDVRVSDAVRRILDIRTCYAEHEGGLILHSDEVGPDVRCSNRFGGMRAWMGDREWTFEGEDEDGFFEQLARDLDNPDGQIRGCMEELFRIRDEFRRTDR